MITIWPSLFVYNCWQCNYIMIIRSNGRATHLHVAAQKNLITIITQEMQSTPGLMKPWLIRSSRGTGWARSEDRGILAAAPSPPGCCVAVVICLPLLLLFDWELKREAWGSCDGAWDVRTEAEEGCVNNARVIWEGFAVVDWFRWRPCVGWCKCCTRFGKAAERVKGFATRATTPDEDDLPPPAMSVLLTKPDIWEGSARLRETSLEVSSNFDSNLFISFCVLKHSKSCFCFPASWSNRALMGWLPSLTSSWELHWERSSLCAAASLFLSTWLVWLAVLRFSSRVVALFLASLTKDGEGLSTMSVKGWDGVLTTTK